MEYYILLGKHCVLLILLVGCLYTDLANGKIYDYAVLPAFVLGLLLSFALGGLWDNGLQGVNLGSSLLAAVVAGGVFVWPYAKGGIGGGDVKLMAAVGAVGGFHDLYVVMALIYTAVFGAAMAVVLLIWRGRLWEGLKGSLRFVFSLKRVDVEEGKAEDEEPEKLTIPYGTAICLGSMLAWFVTELGV